MSGRRTAISVFGGIGTVILTGYYYRPLPLQPDNSSRNRKGFISSHALTDYANRPLPKLYDLCRHIVVAFQVTLSRFFMFYTGKFRIVDNESYHNFVKSIIARDSDTSVITISNHRCLLDDALLFSCLLPFWLNAQPRFLRYTLCAQEFCFDEKVAFSIKHSLSFKINSLFCRGVLLAPIWVSEKYYLFIEAAESSKVYCWTLLA